MLKKILCLILGLLFPLSLNAVTVSLAPLEYVVEGVGPDKQRSKSLQKMLADNVSYLSRWKTIYFESIKTARITPASFLEALDMCLELGLDFLLYGFVEQGEYSIRGEVKLLEKESREVIAAFYSSDIPGEEERLFADLALKIVDWFSDAFDLGPIVEEEPPQEGILSFLLSAGVWRVLSQQWPVYLDSVFTIDFQTRFIPLRPGIGKNFSEPYFRTGLAGFYYYSRNQSGIEEFKLSTIGIGVPLGIVWDNGARHTFSLNFTSMFLIDYLIWNRLYDGWVSETACGFSVSIDGEYSFRLNKYISLGMNQRMALHSFDPRRIVYSLGLFSEVSLQPLSRGDLK